MTNDLARIVGGILLSIDALATYLLAQTDVTFDPGIKLVIGGVGVVTSLLCLYLNVRMPGQSSPARGQAAVGYIGRVVLAVVVGVVTWLVCVFVGSILADLGVPIADTVGSLLRQFAVVIGFLAALWYFFAGRAPG